MAGDIFTVYALSAHFAERISGQQERASEPIGLIFSVLRVFTYQQETVGTDIHAGGHVSESDM